jgi:hypothetical protein
MQKTITSMLQIAELVEEDELLYKQINTLLDRRMEIADQLLVLRNSSE